MTSTTKKISIDELMPGMYVEDVLNEKGLLLYNANTVVIDMSQVQKLRNHGVREVCINTALSETGSKQKEKKPSEIDLSTSFFDGLTICDFSKDYKKEINKAQMLKSRTTTLLKNCMLAAQCGNSVSASSIEMAISVLAQEVVTNQDVFFAMCRLQSNDDPIYVHSVNVAIMSAALAHSMNLSKEAVVECAVGALLHDIGKIRFPEEFRKKTGSFTKAEYDAIKQHPSLGVELLDETGVFSSVCKSIVMQHHERWNGGGYPEGISKENIMVPAMICALSDTYDNLTTKTENRRECLPQEAMALIFQGVDEEYPPYMVDAFIRLMGIYPVGSFVKLKSGEVGMVVKNDHNNLMAPVVIMCFDKKTECLKKPFMRNLASNRKDSLPPPWKIDSIVNPSEFGINVNSVLNSI
ncbi:metal dependent phosphohydrolase [Chitinispirillum alkaliphilum]|nr:metal dependent phosphohydrolase [Chitinispirillum alkaliphilum]